MKKRRYQSLVGLALVASLVNPTPWLGQSSLFESTKVLAAEEETPPEDIQEPDARQLAALNNLEKLLIEFESYINDDNKEEAGYFLEDEQANVERLLMATSNTSRGQVATVQWRALLERYNGASTPIPTPTPVVEIKEERRRELIPFTETEVSDETMLEGTKEVITKGVNGEVEIVEAVTYTDGVETIRKETSRSELVKMVPQVVRVGTKKAPVTITKEETKTEVVPFTEKRIADATLEEGKEVITTQGVKGERTIIEMITYMDGVEINRVEKSNTITKAPVTQVVTYGTQKPSVAPVVTTKETIKTETIPFTEIREDDSSLEEGREVVAVEGKKGERTIVETVTYTDGVETGRVVKSDTVTTPAVNKVIKVGTKKAPIITTEDITTVVEFDFAETRIADATLEEGKEVITTQGVKGERTIVETITYMDGVETGRVVKSDMVTTPAVNKVIKVGTKKVSPSDKKNKNVVEQPKEKMSDENVLPKTGEKSSTLTAIGLGLLAGMMVFIGEKRKRNN
ncbi:TPA: G5 domain-containing protein [Streptococcus suis 2524]|uniref:G5 domain-containing protein n=1 Tax=Streptococcus suis TaxID=1307 RepID=UPI000F642EF8|nr:G5 domain-containing protein [Streptococcus suis]HEM3217933.1 G5 domain-containing protein [Streptococcus suis 2524]RRR31117.1 LPXTG cell wall anchor domain-containing protein [Streptococcus suis]RRR38143.1 LPXTG cell wall anchor domain-containing protein [Streptococcus suis]RRR53414.1 LPXTG cell wall anchor domain-containing protein [Streptococcus suis]RRR58537.1 LPXTG cell wall anchor domain-containing protein [Streptococcus suis]